MSYRQSIRVARPVSAAVITTVLLGALTGCFLSGSGDGSAPRPVAPSTSSQAQIALTTLVRQSAASTKSLSSVHLRLGTTGKIDGLGRISAADLDVQVKPLRATGTVTYDGQLDVPFRLVDDTVSVKLFDEWTPIGSVSDLFPPGLIDPSAGVARILESVNEIRARGQETIDGIVTTKITGVIAADVAKTMLPQSDDAKTITVWIRPDGDHEVVRSLVEVSAGNTLQNTLSKWNIPVVSATN